MNTKEFVQISGDSWEVPIKYAVIETTVGSNTAGTYLWLKCIGYGFDTIAHFDAYVASLDTSVTDTTGIKGSFGVYSVITLNLVQEYNTPKSNHAGPYLVG